MNSFFVKKIRGAHQCVIFTLPEFIKHFIISVIVVFQVWLLLPPLSHSSYQIIRDTPSLHPSQYSDTPTYRWLKNCVDSTHPALIETVRKESKQDEMRESWGSSDIKRYSFENFELNHNHFLVNIDALCVVVVVVVFAGNCIRNKYLKFSKSLHLPAKCQ